MSETKSFELISKKYISTSLAKNGFSGDQIKFKQTYQQIANTYFEYNTGTFGTTLFNIQNSCTKVNSQI